MADVPTLTQAQIAQVARAAGLPGDPDVWAAVAMAESSGRTDIVNEIGCVGLWQINQPVHVKAHPQWTVAWLQNPMNNAKAAKEIYRSQGWGAWEAYTGKDGRGSDGPWRNYYKKNVGASAAGWDPLEDFWNDLLGPPERGPGSEGWDEGLPGDGLLPDLGIGDVATGIGTIAEAVAKTAVWLGDSRNWVRIAYVAGGAVLVGMGLSIVAKPVLAGTPAGRVAKAARARVKSGAAKTTKVKESSGGGQGNGGGGGG
jgi:hypothetical protein